MKYEYGKEYETNGEKPDLPGDVEVEWWNRQRKNWTGMVTVDSLNWAGDKISRPVERFRIVDERYKPKDHIADAGEKVNDWYERGELPPEGEVVNYDGEQFEMLAYRHWEGELLAVLYNPAHGFARHVEANPGLFRPLRTERDVLVEKCTSILEKGVGDCEPDKYLAQQIVDAGWRPIKQQTENEFVKETHDYLPDAMARTAYRAGCRFVDMGE